MPPRDLSRDLVRLLKELKLGKLIPTLPERLRQARERGMDPEDLLLVVLSEEVQRRDSNRLADRAGKARLSPSMVFDEWDAGAKVTYDRHLLDQLRLLRFLEQRRDLAGCLDRLAAEALRGEAWFKVYRQFKMYNDPDLNPAVYGEKP